jgi:Ni/Co efflux regulator RcnB
MTSKHTISRGIALILAAFVAAGPALAEKDKGHGHGKDKHGDKHAEKHHGKHQDKGGKHARHDTHRDDVKVGAFFSDSHRHAARAYYVQQYPAGRGCPPGLAKKNNGCLPPGQAKKWAVGQPLPREVRYYTVPQPVILSLPAAPVGYRYVRVGNDILLLSPQSALVVDVISGLLG